MHEDLQMFSFLETLAPPLSYLPLCLSSSHLLMRPAAGNKSILAAKAPLWPKPPVTQTVTQKLHNNMYIHDDAFLNYVINGLPIL